MSRNLTIDIIRVVCIIYIIAIWHVSDYTSLFSMDNDVCYSFTCAAMGAFMFISGFLLKGKYDIDSFIDIIRFVKRRFIRIVPLYIIAASYFVLVGDIQWWRILLSLIGLSSFIQPMTNTLWFVEMILLFYLLYPLLWSRHSETTILKAVVVYLAVWLLNGIFYDIDVRFFYYFPCFVFGMILPHNEFNLWQKSWKLFMSALIIFALVVFSMYSNESKDFANYLLYTIIALCGTHIIVYLCNSLSKMRLGGGISFLAYISMAAYMFHRQIIYIIYHIYWPEDGIGRILYLIFVCLPIITFLGWIIQKSYDKVLSLNIISKHLK